MKVLSGKNWEGNERTAVKQRLNRKEEKGHEKEKRDLLMGR